MDIGDNRITIRTVGTGIVPRFPISPPPLGTIRVCANYVCLFCLFIVVLPPRILYGQIRTVQQIMTPQILDYNNCG